MVDVRDEEAVKAAIDKTAAHFGGLDIVVNNASAIGLTPATTTDMRRFDLMTGPMRAAPYGGRNTRSGTRTGRQPHISCLSPPST